MSSWSAGNRGHVARLLAEGRMTPAGLAPVAAAKADGRWESVYAGSAAMVIAEDFPEALEARPAAKAFFATLDRKNLYPIYYRLQTAKRPRDPREKTGPDPGAAGSRRAVPLTLRRSRPGPLR